MMKREELTSQMIEAGARELFRLGNERIGPRSWDDVGCHYLKEAEACLVAALVPPVEITVHVCGAPLCPETGKEHDWSGPRVSRSLPGGCSEGGASCKGCGMFYGDWALMNLP